MTPEPLHAPAHTYAPRLPWGLTLVLQFLMALFAGIGMPLPPDTIDRIRLRPSDADCDPYVLLLEAATRAMRAERRRHVRARRERLQRSGHAEKIPTPAEQAAAHRTCHPAAAGPSTRRCASRPLWPPAQPKLAFTRQRLLVPI